MDKETQIKKFFEPMDLNEDGTVGKAEMVSWIAKFFDDTILQYLAEQ